MFVCNACLNVCVVCGVWCVVCGVWWWWWWWYSRVIKSRFGAPIGQGTCEQFERFEPCAKITKHCFFLQGPNKAPNPFWTCPETHKPFLNGAQQSPNPFWMGSTTHQPKWKRLLWGGICSLSLLFCSLSGLIGLGALGGHPPMYFFKIYALLMTILYIYTHSLMHTYIHIHTHLHTHTPPHHTHTHTHIIQFDRHTGIHANTHTYSGRHTYTHGHGFKLGVNILHKECILLCHGCHTIKGCQNTLMSPFAGRRPAKGDIRAAGWGDGGWWP